MVGREGAEGSLENHIYTYAEERALEKMAYLQSAEFTTGVQGRVAIPSIVFLVRFILRSSIVASSDLAN